MNITFMALPALGKFLVLLRAGTAGLDDDLARPFVLFAIPVDKHRLVFSEEKCNFPKAGFVP